MSSQTLKIAIAAMGLLCWTAPSFADYLANCANASIAAVLPNSCQDIKSTEGFLSPYAPPQPSIQTELQSFDLSADGGGSSGQQVPSQSPSGSSGSGSSSGGASWQ